MSTQTYRLGVLFAVFAGVFLSSAGVMVRFIESADPWTVLFYRSLTFSITVFVFICFRDPGRVWSRYAALTKIDMIVSIALAVGFIFYLLSLFHTTVANTVLLISTGPFFAALLGWLVLGERVGFSTLLAMCVALVGVGIMVFGETSFSDLLGMAYAIAAVLAFATMVVALRYSGSDHDSMPATSLAGLLAAAICLFFAPTLVISSWDLLMAVGLGSVQIGIGFIFITLATRSVPAAQVPLYALGETALAPLWVWLVVNEIPQFTTLLGGALVLLAVIYRSAIAYFDGRRELNAQ